MLQKFSVRDQLSIAMLITLSNTSRASDCFIAGTPVHTDKGLVPIDQITVGDLVLSLQEEGGERAYKRVTRTFIHEDAPIWVVKYMLIDGDVPWGHPEYMPKDKTLHHCYATGNHPFWVEGMGWTAVEKLRESQVFELANGKRAHVDLVWPVIRSREPGFGRVCSNAYAEGQEVHIVDFRSGSDLWKYRWNRHDEATVPYVADIPDFDQSGLPDFLDPDAVFTTRVYNLEVEDFHTYYIGELGVWVRSRT